MLKDQTKVAVIDLGTNTFHLVIFQKKDGEVLEIYRKRHHVFLSESGIETIGDESIHRAHIAIMDFQTSLNLHNPNTTKIIGTEALRVASNGPSLSNFIKSKLNSEVEIISGEREAELIAKGVMWELGETINNAMIMDIGGGSVEFIHIVNNQIQWLNSFPIGVGVLYNNVKHSEPIQTSEIEKLDLYIASKTTKLIDYLKINQVENLIGSSGSFEIIPAVKEEKYPPEINKSVYSIEDFHDIYEKLVHAPLEERLKIKGLPPVRAQLIVVAFVLMDWLIKKANVSKLNISKYAVKEGLVAETLELL